MVIKCEGDGEMEVAGGEGAGEERWDKRWTRRRKWEERSRDVAEKQGAGGESAGRLEVRTSLPFTLRLPSLLALLPAPAAAPSLCPRPTRGELRRVWIS